MRLKAGKTDKTEKEDSRIRKRRHRKTLVNVPFMQTKSTRTA